MLDGKLVPAEIQIEQFDQDGKTVGRSASAFTDENGYFSASIDRHDTLTTPLACRLVVRVSPSEFDETAPRQKVVQLKRSVNNGDTLTLLLTQ